VSWSALEDLCGEFDRPDGLVEEEKRSAKLEVHRRRWLLGLIKLAAAVHNPRRCRRRSGRRCRPETARKAKTSMCDFVRCRQLPVSNVATSVGKFQVVTCVFRPRSNNGEPRNLLLSIQRSQYSQYSQYYQHYQHSQYSRSVSPIHIP
jgi:hypothetical protein